ncbi:MAG: esterase-like activity of phytase family protein [Pseudomonadota bacterium]
MKRCWLAVLCVAFLVPQAKALEVMVRPLSLAQGADAGDLGPLRLAGVLELTAAASGFGGFSGLALGPDGRRFIAVSDAGMGWAGALAEDAEGRLVGVADNSLFPLLGLDGQPLGDKHHGDAEAVGLMPEGDALLIAFEQWHRIWRYPLNREGGFASLAQAVPTSLDVEAALAGLPDNGGIEAMAVLADGAALALSEDGDAGGGARRAWRFGAPSLALRYQTPLPHVPTDAAALPDGRVLVLHRHWSPFSGASGVLAWFDATSLAANELVTPRLVARLAPPFPVDNFEGLAVRPAADGGLDLFLITDDNFNPLQKTLLIKLHWPASALP